MEMKMTYNLSCRLFTDAKCFGPGVAQLLHAVQRLHSLRAAALSMDMAYSKAWTIIKNSEKALGFSAAGLHHRRQGRRRRGTDPGGSCGSCRAYDTFCSRTARRGGRAVPGRSLPPSSD